MNIRELQAALSKLPADFDRMEVFVATNLDRGSETLVTLAPLKELIMNPTPPNSDSGIILPDGLMMLVPNMKAPISLRL